jgi:putative acetyltransferase
MTLTIRPSRDEDRAAIHQVEEAAFGRDDEAGLVDRLIAGGDDVLELVAERDGDIIGHILFTRLCVEGQDGDFDAVALAPLAVAPDAQDEGIGSALVSEAHRLLQARGETLSVVLGEPAYYGRFGYRHARAASFECEWQCEELQAIAWGDAPVAGRLVYAPAFSEL